MRLNGAVALVTGGSSGIGAATARALSAAGVKLLITGRDQGRLREVAERTGAVAIPSDLSAPGGPAELAGAALRAAATLRAGTAGSAQPPGAPGETGGIDILVNNAGVGWAGPIGQITADQVAELVAVNLTAPIQLTRLLAPGMLARGRGQVVFVSSIAMTGVRGEAVYSATKAGLGSFADSLAYELNGNGVRVSVVVPGVIATEFFVRRGQPYARKRPAPLPAERVARAIVSCLERERDVVYVPRWMWLPARLHGTAPAAFRVLASRFGGSS